MSVWVFLIFILVGQTSSTSSEFKINDEDYYKLPDLFTLEDYEKCLSQENNVYCLGTFELSERSPNTIFNELKILTKESSIFFNHTKIYRGVCLSKHGKCKLSHSSRKKTFEDCVSKDMETLYGLQVNLQYLDYCKDKNYERKFDHWDYLFIAYGSVVIILNILGTSYDIFVKDDQSGGSWLLAFSLKSNWNKLTRRVEPNNQHFKCFHFIKASIILIVHIAHAMMAIVMGFAPNPRYMELAATKPELAIFYNGTVLIQTYIVTTTFLRTLKTFSDAQTRKLDFYAVVESVADRIVRVSPSLITMVGFCSTMMPHLSDGPLWKKYVEDEADLCRDTFWRYFFLLQNFYPPGCLGQTWYLSVDFQIYLAATLITIYLARQERNFIRSLLFLIVTSLMLLFGIVSYFDLKPLSMVLTPENIFTCFKYEKSFHLLYQTFWGNFPSGVVGISACLFYFKLKSNMKITQNQRLFIACQLSIIVGMIYIITGFWPILPKTKTFISIYATVDKFIFAVITAFFILGCIFYNIGGGFVKSHAWVILSRLSLSSLLIHVVVNRILISGRLFPLNASYLNILSDGFSVSVLTFIFSIPFSLMVEYPAIELYKIISRKKVYYVKNEDVNKNKNKVE